MTTKQVVNPSKFEDIVRMYEKLTGRKASKAEIEAARAKFSGLSMPPGGKHK